MHSISDNEIHIRTIQFDHPKLNPADLLPLLSDDEQQKATRYHFEKDRHAYVITRGTLRQMIGRYLNRAPQDITFEYNQHGKPQLPNAPLAFNVSHSSNFALLAFSGYGSIGVDIERIRSDFNFERIQHRYFSVEQIAAIKNSSDPRTTFFQLWTLKEAFIKAIGTSIFNDLKSFDIPLSANQFTRPDSTHKWHTRSLNIHPEYAAAVIHTIPEATIHMTPALRTYY